MHPTLSAKSSHDRIQKLHRRTMNLEHSARRRNEGIMNTRELTCIGCPLGCTVTVTMDGDTVTNVTGNTCPRGDAYARKEVTAPTRIVTSTVRVTGGASPMVNVKTAADIPKEKIFDCVAAIRDIVVTAPIKIGDVILSNVADTGVDIIAARNIPAL